MLSRHWTWPLLQQSHRRCVPCLVCPARAIGCMFIHPVFFGSACRIAARNIALPGILHEGCLSLSGWHG